ncbi:MAG: WhiB family transcriptional regulator [Acidimicrobiia bacterium]
MDSWQPLTRLSDPEEPEWRGDPGVLVDVLEDLLAVAQRPAWHAQAACRGKGTRLFYAEHGETLGPAKAICATCPVVELCAQAGEKEHHGVWGGRAPREGRTTLQVQDDTLTDALLDLVASTPDMFWSDRLKLWNDAHPADRFRNKNALRLAYRGL